MNYDDYVTSSSGTDFEDETVKEYDSGRIGAMDGSELSSSEVGDRNFKNKAPLLMLNMVWTGVDGVCMTFAA